jgi:pimeloyl-ACP methyl ester carboxylesterase
MSPLVCKYVTVAGVRLKYLERSPLASASHPRPQPPLFLLHQLLATAETFAEMVGHLPGDRRIIVLDILSATPEAGFGTLDVSQRYLSGLISQFMLAVDLTRPVLIGHSYGGALALRLAVFHPDEIEALVLMAPAHPFEGYRLHVVDFYLTRWGRFLALSIPAAPSWMILRAYNQAAGSKHRVTMDQLRPYLLILRHRDTLRRVLDILHCWETDMAELRAAILASPIAAPTLLLWGDEDVIVPLATAPALEFHLSAGEHITLDGIGHLLAEEAPFECARLITERLPGRLPRLHEEMGSKGLSLKGIA